MVSCKVKGCRNRSDKKAQPKLHFYSFPRNEETASKWLEVCKKSVNIKNSRVCSAHFKASCYKPKPIHLQDLNYSPGVRTLLPDAIPTENTFTEDVNRKIINRSNCMETKDLLQNNDKNKNVLNICNSTPNVKASTVLFLRVIDNNSHGQIKSISTPLTSVKYLSGHPNLDVRLERVEAPAHILDHQYAINSNLNTDSLNTHVKVENEHNNFIVNTNTNLEIKSISGNKTSEQEEIVQLKKQLKTKIIEQQNLQKQLKRLQNEKKAFVNMRVRDILKNVFSPRQIEKLINPYKTKIKWTIEDIISAISLQNISLKAYRYLRENNYPLPGLSTIRKWTANIKMSEGLLSDVLTLMRHKANSLSIFQKIVVLNFGKICISHKNGQSCMVRGLFYKWIQPIYYSFDEPLSAHVIKEITSKLYDIGYIVVAITCNLESFNDQIWTELNVGVRHTQQCYLEHPNNKNYKIFIFPCELNLLISIGKHFVDNGFIIKGKRVNKQCIDEIIEINSRVEGEKFYKLTQEFLDDCKSDKQNSSLVKKLFSKTIAKEISYYGEEGFILYKDWKDVANFFELIGKWIDLFSSKVKEGYKDGEEPYGLCLEYQNNILSKVEKLMRSTRIESFETLLPFQDQVILKCTSLKQLLIYLQESFSIEDFQIKYILTAQLDSDSLENLYEYLSDKDASINQSSITKFQSRLRKCVLGRHSYDASSNGILKFKEPCLIDFNEKSESPTIVNNVQKQKGYALETAEKMRRFLTVNNISTQKVHKNLLHIISKKT